MAILALMAISLAFAQLKSADFPKHDFATIPVIAKIHTGGNPDWLAMGFGSVWVSVPKTNEIVRIDPNSNSIQARIVVDQEPCYGIGIGPTRVWVLNCKSQTVTRIDPRRNKVDLRVKVSIAPEGEGSIAVGYKHVWFVGNEDGHSSVLMQLDAINGHTLRKITVGKDSAVVTLGFGSVWVTSSGENAVYRVNPGSGRVTDVIAVAAGPRFTTVHNNSLWVLSQSNGSASRIDPLRNKVDLVVNAGVPGAGGDICGGKGYIWLAAAGTPVTRISKSGKIIDQYGNYPGADAIRFGFYSVWVSDHARGDIWRIDPNKLPAF
jgi:virginiamycin B lyase